MRNNSKAPIPVKNPRFSRFRRQVAIPSVVLLLGAAMLAFVLPVHAAVGDRGRNMNITFPDTLLVQNGGPILNLKRPPQGIRAAKGDGKTDDTASFRDAYDFLKREFVRHGGWNQESYYVYLPVGVYRVSDTLIYRGETVQQPKGKWKGDNFDINHIRFIGQSRQRTVVRLADRCSGYGNAQKPKVVMAFQHPDTVFNNVPGGNWLRNLTIDTGNGNPGAVGLYFQGANQSDLRSITVRSGDGAGKYGLWFKIGSVQGYYSDVTVEGFDIGIFQPVNAEGDPAFEYLTLRNQKVAGILHTGGGLSLRGLLSDQRPGGAVGLRLDGSGTQAVLLDSVLRGGTKTASLPSVEMTADTGQSLFVRNVSTSGYKEAVRKAGVAAVPGSTVDEYVSHPVTTLFPDQPLRSLNLPIRDTPEVRWYDPRAQWAIVDDYPSVQAAFDSGKPVVVFKKRRYELPGDVRVPASVKFVNVLAAHIKGGALIVDRPSTDPLLVQDSTVPIRVLAQRDVIQRCAGGGISNPRGLPVTFFLENVNDVATGEDFCRPGQKIFARQIDVEYGGGNQIVVNGGTMWVFGYKTENRPAVPFTVRNNGTLEILGGYTNTTSAHDEVPLLRNDGGNVSATLFTNLGGRLTRAVEEIRGDKTVVLRSADLPRRGGGYSGDYVVPLYVGTAASPAPPVQKSSALPGVPGQWAQTFADEFEGTTVDKNKWKTQWREFDKDGEIFYQPYRFLAVNLESNLTVKKGVLTIRSSKEGVSWDPKVKFTTGVINSAQKFSQKFGYFEARMKSPDKSALGTDAAFWLFPVANRWPPELDIHEIPGSGAAKSVLLNQHFVKADGTRGDRQKYHHLTEGTFADDWHTFGLLWQPGLVVWYVDGVERHRSTENVPDEPMVLFCSTEIQGGWTGDPEKGSWPQQHQVDYIHVYRRIDRGSQTP